MIWIYMYIYKYEDDSRIWPRWRFWTVGCWCPLCRYAAMPGHWRDALRLLTEAVSSKLRPSSPLRNSRTQRAELRRTVVTCCDMLWTAEADGNIEVKNVCTSVATWSVMFGILISWFLMSQAQSQGHRWQAALDAMQTGVQVLVGKHWVKRRDLPFELGVTLSHIESHWVTLGFENWEFLGLGWIGLDHWILWTDVRAEQRSRAAEPVRWVVRPTRSPSILSWTGQDWKEVRNWWTTGPRLPSWCNIVYQVHKGNGSTKYIKYKYEYL